MGTFSASVQYNDWEGTVAADRADKNDLNDYLKTNGLAKDDEFVIAATVYIAENRSDVMGHTRIRALLFHGSSLDFVATELNSLHGPIPVREVDIPLPLSGFIDLFKRFSLNLTVEKLNLEGREYDVIG